MQEYEEIYFDTFNTVAKFMTFKILHTIVVTNQWLILELDVSNSFLHEVLHNTVYMKQPPKFQNALYPNHGCLLKKSIYGHKQPSQQWFSIFISHLL